MKEVIELPHNEKKDIRVGREFGSFLDSNPQGF